MSLRAKRSNLKIFDTSRDNEGSHRALLWQIILKRLFLLFILVPFAFYFRSIYRDRLGAFGCFDDCFNIVGGYFITQGKHLYSEIFFNHQPLMAYLSALIQYVTKPDLLYLLIYQHRMALIWFSMVMGGVLTLRFGLIGFGFTLLSKLPKVTFSVTGFWQKLLSCIHSCILYFSVF